MSRQVNDALPISTKLAGTSSASATLSAPSSASSSSNHASVTAFPPPGRAFGERGDERAAAQLLQAPRPRRADAADRDAQVAADLGVRFGRIAHEHRQQLPAALPEIGERAP